MWTNLLLLAACERTPAPQPAPKPTTNVVLITLDTTRADVIGAYGNPLGLTPNLDRLAQESARFTHAYTVTPLTIPAHSSIFTGLLPPRHGVRDNGDFFLSDGATTLAERFRAAGYATMASVGAEVTSHHWGFGQGFDAYFDDMGATSESEGSRWRVERRGDAVVADALGWLEQNGGKDRPFFTWVHLFDVHHPYRAPEPYGSRFPKQPYLGEVAYADAQVGVLLDWLTSRGLMERTAVVVVSDHGEGLGSHGEGFHGVLLYNATTHIPMLVRPAGGLSAPTQVGFPVSLVDVMPTALALADQPVPEGLDGMDLSEWVVERAAQPAAPVDRAVLLEALYGFRHYGWAPQRAIVTDDAKLIDSTTPELYSRGDMAEQDNLSARAAPQVKTLRERIRALYAGMTPDEALSSEAELSPERLAQLEALGYVTSGQAPAEGDGFDEGLPDPVQRMPSLRGLEAARGAVQSGDLAEAERVIRELIAKEPGLNEAQNLLANVLARQGRVDDAIELLRRLDEARPSAALKTQMGTMELRRGRVGEALVLLGAALDQDPYLSLAWGPYLHSLFLSGDRERLAREVARAREKLPDLTVAIGMQGTVLAMAGDYTRASPLLKQALARDPLLPLVNFGLGVIAAAGGSADAAETHFLEEIRISPPGIPARRELVKLYASQQRYDEQLAQLDVIVKASPEDVLLLHARAQALYNLKRFAEAEEAVERCLKAGPRFPACKMLQANTLGQLGRTDEAERAYQEALLLAEEKKAERP